MKPPIADPFAPEVPNGSRVFRVALIDSFFGHLCCFLVVLTPILLPTLEPIRDDREMGVLFAIMLGATLVATILSWLPKVEVSKEGLKGNSSWGIQRKVDWNDIIRVRFAWFVFRYAIISTRQKRNLIWLPLYLRNMQDFAQTIEEWAPEGNPLRLFLQKRGF